MVYFNSYNHCLQVEIINLEVAKKTGDLQICCILYSRTSVCIFIFLEYRLENLTSNIANNSVGTDTT